MIFKDQAPCARPGLPLEEKSGGYAADPTTDDDAIIDLARLDDVFRQRIVDRITNLMAGFQNW